MEVRLKAWASEPRRARFSSHEYQVDSKSAHWVTPSVPTLASCSLAISDVQFKRAYESVARDYRPPTPSEKEVVFGDGGRVFFVRRNGGTSRLRYPIETTFGQLKKILSCKTGFKPCEFRLVFKGSICMEMHTLATLANDDTLHFVPQVTGS